jgi:amidase
MDLTFPWQRPQSLRLALLVASAALCSLQATGQQHEPAASFDLEEATVADLQQRMSSDRETARSLAEKYLARIEAIDRRGPAVHAVLEINPEALAIADELDAERKAKGLRGPLHGIPVLLKDNIATGDRMATTAGSLALKDVRAPRDAFIVRRLREAGAVILGKTNLSEWANIRSNHSSSGWSALGGQTRNPYALDRNPSGSSSGSAVAVAANLCAVSIGTETDGSIVSPASANGIVGIKPTVGLLSRAGIVPISHTQDTPGPMARTVADAALLLGALAGPDAEDAATRSSDGKRARDYTQFLAPGRLEGIRIGVVRGKLFGYNAGADELAERAIADLKALGARIVDPANIPTVAKLDDSELDVLLTELKADLAAYFAWRGPASPVHSLEDVIAFNEKNKDREMPWFGQELFLQAVKKGPLAGPKYRASLAKDRRLAGPQGIDAVMKKHRLDALVAPTSAPAWLIDLVNGDPSSGGSSTVPAVAGYPHVTVPAGFVRGLPVGMSFFGRAWSEPVLLRIAYAYEQATKHRRAPQFSPTADLGAAAAANSR